MGLISKELFCGTIPSYGRFTLLAFLIVQITNFLEPMGEIKAMVQVPAACCPSSSGPGLHQ